MAFLVFLCNFWMSVSCQLTDHEDLHFLFSYLTFFFRPIFLLVFHLDYILSSSSWSSSLQSYSRRQVVIDMSWRLLALMVFCCLFVLIVFFSSFLHSTDSYHRCPSQELMSKGVFRLCYDPRLTMAFIFEVNTGKPSDVEKERCWRSFIIFLILSIFKGSNQVTDKRIEKNLKSRYSPYSRQKRRVL